jgi:hypothetical protein
MYSSSQENKQSPIPGRIIFWSVNFPGGAVESQPEVFVTWHLLDIEVEAITNDGNATNASTPDDHWFMIAGIDPMDPGCWQVSAEYKGAELTYVYEISTPEPTLDS